MFIDNVLCAIDGAHPTDLDRIGSDISRSYGNGALSEDEHLRLWEALDARRALDRLAAAGAVAARQPAPVSAPRATTWRRRAVPCSPDRIASRQRRRDIGQERWLPPCIASKLTPGEIAVLSVEVREIVKHGVCSLTNGAIAAQAGVCETMVKKTRRLTVLLGFIRVIHRPRRGQKSLTNLVYALSPELRAWIATRCRMIGGTRMPPAQADLRKKEPSGTGLHHQSRQHRARGP
jgi:hypothetical protein